MNGHWEIRGIRSDGTSTIGRWEADADAELTIRSRYDRGWRKATLTLDGVEVGWIGDNPDGERVWWTT